MNRNFTEKFDASMAKTDQHHHRMAHLYRRVLHILELVIATITIAVLIGALCVEVYRIFTDPAYFGGIDQIESFLHHILTIVVGLEFVRMLIDMTPGNTLEVLIMATARHIIMNHDDQWSLLVGTVCIAGLFATRRFLIRRSEMKEELVETE